MNFEIQHRETAYAGRAFRVQRLHMRLPDGAERIYDLVEHIDSVSIVPFDSQGNILFVEQYRVGSNSRLLELPAGVMEIGEEPLHCAEREIREETGMAATQMKLLGEYYLAPGYTSEKMYAFLATGLYHAPLKADDDEFIQTRAIPAAEVFAMIRRGELIDGKSLAALLLAQPFLEELQR